MGVNKFDFENGNKLKFRDLSSNEKLCVINALEQNTSFVDCLIQNSSDLYYDEWITVKQSEECNPESNCVLFNSIYRVRKPYTLDDALHDIDMCSNAPFLDEAIIECKNIAVRLAESLGGDK